MYGTPRNRKSNKASAVTQKDFNNLFQNIPERSKPKRQYDSGLDMFGRDQYKKRKSFEEEEYPYIDPLVVTENPHYLDENYREIFPPRIDPNRRNRRRRVTIDSMRSQGESISEKTELFKIHSKSIDSFDFTLNHGDLVNENCKNENRMLKSKFCEETLVLSLWEQKNRMDPIFDAKKGHLYYKVRDSIFVQDHRGSKHFKNRAGDKLWEVLDAVDLLGQDVFECVFLDVCGGPGAFSLLLLDEYNFKKGFGITLDVPMTNNEAWYDRLKNTNKYKILWGQDGTGNVYVPSNLEMVYDELKNEDVRYVVSDGGFKIGYDDKGNHLENIQELLSGRIILSEATAMINILSEGGNFVVKLFDTFSSFTVSLIYIISQIFEETFIVKPTRSRIVNSERYLVGKHLKKGSSTDFFKAHLNNVHSKLYELDLTDNNVLPLSLIPYSYIMEDNEFFKGIKNMNDELSLKQTKAIKQVMDEVEQLVENE